MARLWFRKRTADAHLAELLDACLAGIERGEATVESCLAAYPAEAEQLRPLLRTALAARGVFDLEPSAAAYTRMRAKVLAATQPRPMPVARRPIWQPAMAAGLAMAFLGLLAAPITALQSTDAVPGDWDYGLKRAGERVRLAVTVEDEGRRAVHLALVERRLREIDQLLAENRTDLIPEAVRAASTELASIQDSLSKERAISLPEAEKIAKLTARQEAVLGRVEREAPAPVAEVAREAKDNASVTRNSVIQAVAQRNPEAAQRIEQEASAVAAATPSPAPQARQASPSPRPAASPSPSPSTSPAPTPTPSPTPSASPLPEPSAVPSASPSASPLAGPPTPSPTAPANASVPSSTPTPTATASPAPRLAPTLAPTPEPTPVRTIAPQGVPLTPVPSPTASPRPTPSPTPASTPTPGPRTVPSPSAVVPGPLTSPSPSASPSGLTSVTVPAPGMTLPAGRSTFVYTGQPTTLLALLAQAQGGTVTEVAVRNSPGGYWMDYRPGDAGGEFFLLLPGAEVRIVVTAETRLNW